MVEKGTLIQERYRLDRLLGEGGMAEVWLGVDERIQRPVAIKLLRPQYARNEALLERFRREATLVARLKSPYIVQVFDVTAGGSPSFIVMEWVDGQDLKETLRYDAPLEVSRALSLLRDIASGVAVAHKAGMIHRDLKPGNILISRRGEVKITDFGIARDVAGGGLTEPGTVWGTSHYLAPEQATGGTLSPATDIYALGVLLFEMLTGRLPYPGDDPVAVGIAHIQQPVPDAQIVNGAIPAGIARLIARMMAKDPAERPADGSVLVEILNGYLDRSGGETIARPTVPAPATPVIPVREPDRTPPPPVEPAPSNRARPAAATPGRRVTGPLSATMLAFLALCLLVGAVGLYAADVWPRFGTGLAPEDAAAAPPTTQPVGTETPALPTVSVAPTSEPTETAEPSPTTEPTATAPLFAISGREGNGPNAQARRLAAGEGVMIDGSLSEWRSVPVGLDTPVEGSGQWSGSTDLSGEAQFAWDEQFLYLAVRRSDDTFVQTEGGFELYRGDSVELWLDAELMADFDEAVANEGGLLDDFQLAFSPGDFNQLRPEGVVYYPLPRDENRNNQLRVGATYLPPDGGYFLEARIPWSMLNVTPQPNTVMGYVVVLNDIDEPGVREPQSQVASNRAPPFQKPFTFGNLILLP